MQINLVLGKKIKMPIYKNIYELVVEYMYGDMNGGTTSTIYYKPNKKNQL